MTKLTAGTWLPALAIGLVLAAAGRTDEAVRCGIAAAVCWAVSAGTFLVASLVMHRSMTWQLGAVLGGMVFRMGAVLAIGFGLYLGVAVCHAPMFWVWLGVWYLATLLIESVLLARRADDRPTPIRQDG